MLIALDRKEIIYSGRTDRTDPKKPEFIFPASFFRFRFYGRSASVEVTNHRVCWTNRIGAFVDGVQKQYVLNDEGTTAITLLSEEEEREHEIMVFKRMDSCHVFTVESLCLSEGSILLAPEEKPSRRIEVYGDSVSAGEVSEAVDYVGKPDPDNHDGAYSNSWYSYAWIFARKMNAELYDIAQGGIPLVHGSGWVAPPVYPGLEDIWDKVHYHPQLGRVTDWDFTKYTPHLVLIAIGQNDSNPVDYMKEDPEGEKARIWKEKYKELVLKIREKYKNALILLMTTILCHDISWDQAIEEVCEDLADDRVRHFLFKKNGCGTPGHIRIPEAMEMADELKAYVDGLDIPVWEEYACQKTD